MTERTLEKNLIEQLQNFGYEIAPVEDETSLLKNLKAQLELHNRTSFSQREFERILNHLDGGTIFEKAKKLRDRFELQRDDGTTTYVEFFNASEWCKNRYQVANQINMKGKYSNRYDVTLLINGFPLVHIELKKAGVEIKEAFNQIVRYHEHSFRGTIFDYVQIFVISNKANTRYFANNKKQKFEHAFYWTDEENEKISNLSDFAESFLKPCFVSKMIARYIVLSESRKSLMILRPYQYYAVEKIAKRTENFSGNGYVWHTTGSGKTLTSYKASQILSQMPEISKVIFVVDRKDLDIQTVKEFNSFSNGSVDGTENTRSLVRQLKDKNRKLVITTIQKLDKAIRTDFHRKEFLHLSNEKTVLIFDECHRGQFGKTNANIRKFFKNSILIGFTGTPIFKKNSKDGTTTADIFGESLHRYVITDAIRDKNVLGFSVEYLSAPEEDYEDPRRIKAIAEHILNIHGKKTRNGRFNAMFATQSTKIAYEYYKAFKETKHDLKVATIFTFGQNADPEGLSSDENEGAYVLARDNLESVIRDYNKTFGTNFSTEDFYAYYADVQKRMKEKEIDILIVVGIMLTGFDAPRLNTLYVDKNLEYHNLIQAYSRTNRIFDPTKPHGNIVCFRDLKKNTDAALEMYGDKNAEDIIFKKPYKEQLEELNEIVEKLAEIAPSPSFVDKIASEKEKEEFIKAFREILKKKTSLETFTEFSWEDFPMNEETFNEYKSKYLDIYEEEKRRREKEEESLIDEIDFSLELIREDYINYDYIVQLLSQIKRQSGTEGYEASKSEFLKKFDRDDRLKSKKKYVEKFIDEKLPNTEEEKIQEDFDEYWENEKKKFLNHMQKFYALDSQKFEEIVSEFVYRGVMPKSKEIREMFTEKTKESYQGDIKKRNAIVSQIKENLRQYYEIFENW